MKMGRTAAIVLALFVLASALPLAVQAVPTLQASSDPRIPPLYTLRDKQVTLSGSGYSTNQVYCVWVRSPMENTTQYAEVFFTPLASGQIPPGMGLPISTNATLGTYLVSISTSSAVDNSQVKAHFGLWGTLKPLYQRTESVAIMGGGLFPGVSSKLSIRNPSGEYVKTASIASGVKGDFNYTWRIPEDALTEAYKVIVDGTGTFDDSQQDYVSESKFSVTQAALIVKVVQQPSPSYQRTEKAKIALTLSYPDGSPVVKSGQDAPPLLLRQNQSAVASSSMSLTDSANGVWAGEIKIPVNATTSSRYRFALLAMSFDDGFGNKGGAADTFSDYFQVRNASMVITSEVNGTQIQVPFGQVSIISRVAYPDGTSLMNGTVRVFVSTGSSTSEIKLVYDAGINAWRGAYASGLGDLWQVGTWRLRVEVVDPYGNSGTAVYEVAAQPYLFLVTIAAIIAVALFGRWTISRYGRKVYFRIRKLIQKLRALSTERIRP